MPDYQSFNEARTCYSLIDPQLTKRCWTLANCWSVSLKVSVDSYDATLMADITDYCLYNNNGEVLEMVEAKRTRRDARESSFNDFLKYVLKQEHLLNFTGLMQKTFDVSILE